MCVIQTCQVAILEMMVILNKIVGLFGQNEGHMQEHIMHIITEPEDGHIDQM